MGYVIPAGYSRVTLQFRAASPQGSNLVTGFGTNVVPSEALLDAVEFWVTDSYQPRMSEAYQITGIEARSDVEVYDRASGVVGLRSGEASPPNVCALANVTSGLTGRANRGRLFLPGVLLDEDVNDSGGIEGGVRVNLQNMMVGLAAVLDDLSGQIVILHSTVGAPTLATGVTVQSLVATQRRRLRR